MAAAVHQKAIRILAAIRALNPLRVDEQLAEHEKACAAETVQEAKEDPGCPPCHYGWACKQGRCPARNPSNH